jgi:integrase
VWLARYRYRDTDGVTRIVQKVGPTDGDQYGKLAEDALLETLATRRPPSGAPDAIGLDTPVMDLVTAHIARLEQDGRSLQTLQAYRYDAKKLAKLVGGVRVGEATPARLDAVLRSVSNAHGATRARRARTLLRGALALAVMNNILGTNPVRDVQMIRSKRQPKGASALSADQLRDLLGKLRASTYCQDHDLVDPVTLLIATGLRRCELLGLRWSDFDQSAGTLTGHRHPVIMFPSTAGTWRDPDNFAKRWRDVRDELGVADVSTHSFRKSVATLIDDEGLSAWVGADHLGHAKVSMTQDRYMARGKVHTRVADLLDHAVGQP